MDTRKSYPSDVSDEEWAFLAPYLALVREDAPQREHDLREVFNGLRWIVRTGSAWRYMPPDLAPWGRSTTDAAVDKSEHLRGGGPRSSRASAAFGRPGAGPHGGDTGLSHPEIHPGERPSGWIRWAQGQEGLEGTRRGGHFRAPARPAREPGQQGRPPEVKALGGDPAGDRRKRGVGLRRSGIHGREGRGVRCRTRNQARSGQARGGQARLRTVAEALGGGEEFRVGIALSAVGEGLREAARDGGGVALRRIRLPFPPAGSRHPQPRFITHSRGRRRTEAGVQPAKLAQFHHQPL